MASVKTKPTDPAPELPAGQAAAATPNPAGVAEPAPASTAAPQTTTDSATPPPEALNRPGLETPQAPATPVIPDPFVQLYRWKTGETERTLRAIPIPGGCLVRLSAIKGTLPGPMQIAESVCFVPGVKLDNGQLVAI